MDVRKRIPVQRDLQLALVVNDVNSWALLTEIPKKSPRIYTFLGLSMGELNMPMGLVVHIISYYFSWFTMWLWLNQTCLRPKKYGVRQQLCGLGCVLTEHHIFFGVKYTCIYIITYIYILYIIYIYIYIYWGGDSGLLKLQCSQNAESVFVCSDVSSMMCSPMVAHVLRLVSLYICQSQ